MNISSVLFSFLEDALKRQPRAIEAEIKQLMSAQHKTHLAVCIVFFFFFFFFLGFFFARVGLQRITLGYKFELRFLRI